MLTSDSNTRNRGGGCFPGAHMLTTWGRVKYVEASHPWWAGTAEGPGPVCQALLCWTWLWASRSVGHHGYKVGSGPGPSGSIPAPTDQLHAHASPVGWRFPLVGEGGCRPIPRSCGEACSLPGTHRAPAGSWARRESVHRAA